MATATKTPLPVDRARPTEHAAELPLMPTWMPPAPEDDPARFADEPVPCPCCCAGCDVCCDCCAAGFDPAAPLRLGVAA